MRLCDLFPTLSIKRRFGTPPTRPMLRIILVMWHWCSNHALEQCFETSVLRDLDTMSARQFRIPHPYPRGCFCCSFVLLFIIKSPILPALESSLHTFTRPWQYLPIWTLHLTIPTLFLIILTLFLIILTLFLIILTLFLIILTLFLIILTFYLWHNFNNSDFISHNSEKGPNHKIQSHNYHFLILSRGESKLP